MAEEYKVHYFNIRGRAEPIRMILSHVGANWKDERIPYDGPNTVIPPEIKAVSTFGQVPVLEVNGKHLAQTHTICRHLAHKFNIAGKNDWEKAKCDEIVDGVQDFQQLFSGAWGEKDADKKKEIIDTATKNGREKYMKRFNAMLEANNGHFVGSEITWADIVVANAVDFSHKLWNNNVAEGYPAVQKLIQTVFAAKGIKEWIAKRPVTDL